MLKLLTRLAVTFTLTGCVPAQRTDAIPIGGFDDPSTRFMADAEFAQRRNRSLWRAEDGSIVQPSFEASEDRRSASLAFTTTIS